MLSYNIHHISINVIDIAKSISFYEVLGFKECYRFISDDESVSIIHLESNGFIIELFYYDDTADLDERKECLFLSKKLGVNHFSFCVRNINDAYSHLFNEGVKILCPITSGRTGISYFFISDPDNNIIEIVQDDRVIIKK